MSIWRDFWLDTTQMQKEINRVAGLVILKSKEELKAMYPTKETMTNCQVVKNTANHKEFYYCREHKEECGPSGCLSKDERILATIYGEPTPPSITQGASPPNFPTPHNAKPNVAYTQWPLYRNRYYYVDTISNVLRSFRDPANLANFAATEYFYVHKDGTFTGDLNDKSTWIIDLT